MTVSPVCLDTLAPEESASRRRAFLTPAGWTFPGKKSMQQSNVHPKQPAPSRSSELYEVSSETLVQGGKPVAT